MNELLTELKKNQDQLSEYVNLLGEEEGITRLIINSNPDCILQFDPKNGNIMYANLSFEKIFFKEIEGKTIFNLLPTVDKEELIKGAIYNLDANAVGKFNSQIPVIITAISLKIEKGNVLFHQIMVVMKDAREKKRYRKEIKRKTSRKRKKSKTI